MSKSRNEKKPPVPSTVVAVSNDIIAGKFSESQWCFMIEQENTQEYICDIVDSIIESTIKVIYDKYIESQLKPYSVDEAKKLLLQIIETRFLAHDIGEEFPENDLTWQEDDEPTPCMTDSWSQGSVPVQVCPLRPLTAKSSEQPSDGKIENIPEEPSMISSNNQSDILIIDHDHNEQDDLQIGERNEIIAETSISNEVTTMLNTTDIVPSPPTTPKTNNNQESSLNSRHRKHPKSQEKKRRAETRKQSPKLQSKENSNMFNIDNIIMREQSTSYSILPKVQSGRPPAEAEVTYDEHGNVLSMVKLSVDKLPSHRIRTRFNVCDPLLNLTTMKSSQHKMTSKESVMNQLRDTSKAGSIIKQRHDSLLRRSHEIKQVESRRELPPPLADSVNISAGVIIREGQVVRKGPDLYMEHSVQDESRNRHDIVTLKPVGSLTTKQTISVSDVIGKTSPVIRRMRTTEPIPPISPYPK